MRQSRDVSNMLREVRVKWVAGETVTAQALNETFAAIVDIQPMPITSESLKKAAEDILAKQKGHLMTCNKLHIHEVGKCCTIRCYCQQPIPDRRAAIMATRKKHGSRLL